MVVKHNKTGNLYRLIDDECKVKINGEWVDAMYQGEDKGTGEMKSFIREKSDFRSHFTAVGIVTADLDDTDMDRKICVLKEVAREYPGKTIENIIVQMEARRKEVDNEQS